MWGDYGMGWGYVGEIGKEEFEQKKRDLQD
jgi:hypothetical protein